MSVTAGVSDTVIAIWDKLRGNIGQTKVKRQRLCLHSRRRAGGRTGRKLKLMKRIKDRNLLMRQEEVSLLPEEEEEEEEESEYETDSDEDAPDITMKRQAKRKIDKADCVVGEIRKDEEIQKNVESEVNFVDVETDCELNEAEEYDAREAREIARIKRDRNVREAIWEEEIEKVMNMTEEERIRNQGHNPSRSGRSCRNKTTKGAFFQSEADDRAGTDGIYCQDFSAPTGEDKMRIQLTGTIRKSIDWLRPLLKLALHCLCLVAAYSHLVVCWIISCLFQCTMMIGIGLLLTCYMFDFEVGRKTTLS
ncbi:hypothetical protein MLD38_033245 [Melastoma candidum]|uniref:Uncharacterized protein n=1 Tax=Melastoma candidum TaxID=119954 RepID=A0ACB9M6P5_9MYRT|nr:hypothetical protein MLD38_033245 [Melastoma candidum]